MPNHAQATKGYYLLDREYRANSAHGDKIAFENVCLCVFSCVRVSFSVCVSPQISILALPKSFAFVKCQKVGNDQLQHIKCLWHNPSKPGRCLKRRKWDLSWLGLGDTALSFHTEDWPQTSNYMKIGATEYAFSAFVLGSIKCPRNRKDVAVLQLSFANLEWEVVLEKNWHLAFCSVDKKWRSGEEGAVSWQQLPCWSRNVSAARGPLQEGQG